LYWECREGAQINFPESGRGLGHVTPTIVGSTIGYPSDSLASCLFAYIVSTLAMCEYCSDLSLCMQYNLNLYQWYETAVSYN